MSRAELAVDKSVSRRRPDRTGIFARPDN